MFRSICRIITGEIEQTQEKPALVITDDGALMPAFIVEEMQNYRNTVFVTSMPTLFARAVFIYHKSRVHPVDVFRCTLIKAFTNWGSGAKYSIEALNKTSR